MHRFLLVASLAIAAPAFAQSPTAAQRLNALAERLMEGEFDLEPMDEAYAEGMGPRAARPFIDLAPDWKERKRRFYAGVLRDLERIPRERLSQADQVNYDLLRHRPEAQHARTEYPLQEIGFLSPSWGLVSRFIVLASGTQPLGNEKEFAAWLQRVEASAATFDQVIPAVKAAAERGWTTSRPLVEKTLRQIDAVANGPAEKSSLWKAVQRYPAYEQRYRTALEEKLFPAMRRLATFLRDEYLPKARESAGIGTLPGGERAYRMLVRDYTTLDADPDEIHRIGLAEVARVRAKLLEVARSLGFKGEIREFAAWHQSNRANYPFRSGEEVLDYLNKQHARVVPQLPKLFKRLPRAGFEIRLVDPAIAASASASYSRPPADGSRPGIFRIPVRNPQNTGTFGLTALLLHEGMPGHHLDLARAAELDLPRFRKVRSLTVYSEGWGLYAESLGHELGVYDDPWALLGRYSGELHRAARLVVDTGLHHKGWSREQAIRYLVEERGQTEEGAVNATERYMASPGQALAYKTGEMEILRLRAQAQKALGARFDLRDFHEVVLEGPVTLPMLRERVRAWIAREQRAA